VRVAQLAAASAGGGRQLLLLLLLLLPLLLLSSLRQRLLQAHQAAAGDAGSRHTPSAHSQQAPNKCNPCAATRHPQTAQTLRAHLHVAQPVKVQIGVRAVALHGDDLAAQDTSRAQHSTAQHSTAQHSTAQHSTAQRMLLLSTCPAHTHILTQTKQPQGTAHAAVTRRALAVLKHQHAPAGRRQSTVRTAG
jgi:hypothetical protein